MLGFARQDSLSSSSSALTAEAVDEVHRNIEEIPDRQILDFLVQFFIAEVNWLDQLIHIPWFLAKYERWWMVEQVKLVAEVDIAILILRVCSYTSQFLPSPGYTLDKIRGVSLDAIRKTCDEAADGLAVISAATNGQGSLVRIQHLAFFGLRCQTEGNTIAFREVLSRAVRVAQSIGINSDVVRLQQGMDETDKEMERRTFCNLYIWDGVLSRQLDHTAFLPKNRRPGNWPHVDGIRHGKDSEFDAPEPFTERLLQARLADFWRSMGSMQGADYDMVVAEERYDKFCSEYVSQLPRAFALVDADKRWDKRLPKLPLQRLLLHIAIYDTMYWNFRPLLLRHDLERVESPSLPTYKRVLLGSQQKALAVAALRAIEGITQLHALLGDSHTRFAGLVISTFEAAVVLLYVCMDPMFPRDNQHQQIPPLASPTSSTDSLHAGILNLTRHACLQAVQGASKRLFMLAEMNSMADIGASTLNRLMSKLSEVNGKTRLTTNNEMVPNQHEEAGNAATASTASSQMGPTSGMGETTNWLPYDMTDLRPMNHFATMSEMSTVGDMASWPTFEHPNLDSQSDFVSMNTIQHT
ncbi:MAG: hypothetical protein Q9204_003447 [Flavoplaca sp. TL-2023a]